MSLFKKFRSFTYKVGKGMGTVNAIDKSLQQESIQPLTKRVARVQYGKIASRFGSWLLK